MLPSTILLLIRLKCTCTFMITHNWKLAMLFPIILQVYDKRKSHFQNLLILYVFLPKQICVVNNSRRSHFLSPHCTRNELSQLLCLAQLITDPSLWMLNRAPDGRARCRRCVLRRRLPDFRRSSPLAAASPDSNLRLDSPSQCLIRLFPFVVWVC